MSNENSPVQQPAQPQPVPPAAGPSADAYGVPAGPPGEAGQFGAVGYQPPAPKQPFLSLTGPARNRTLGLVVAGALGLSLLSGGVGAGLVLALRPDSGVSAGSGVSVNPEALSRPAQSLAGIAQRAAQGVVTVTVAGPGGRGGVGSGFVYDQQGRILTNAHVVGDAANGSQLQVTFHDGSQAEAKLVGVSSTYDLAVLQVAGKRVTPLPLGDSTTVRAGDAALAIGSPHQLSGTVTSGIISNVGRAWPIGADRETQRYMAAIQTDAPINPGNSGGPLLNAQGQVIGINTSIETAGQTGYGGQSGSIGLGFAIPVNQAKRVAQEIAKTGRATLPVMGVRLSQQELTSGGQPVNGAVLGEITAGSPAQKAGLAAGDVVTSVGDAKVSGPDQLMAALLSSAPGQQVKVGYLRDGKAATATVTLVGEPAA